MYFNKLPNTVKKYSNAVYKSITMKPIAVKPNKCIYFSAESDIKGLNSRIIIMLEFRFTKMYFKGLRNKLEKIL